MTTRRGAAAPVQKAIYARLSADDELKAAVSGVFDHVPERAQMPYVVVGEAIESPDDTLEAFGADTLAGIHVWTRARGFLEGNTIAGRIMALLDRQHHALAVGGHRVVAVRFRQEQPVKDPDPEIRHVIVRFQVVTEQEE